MLTGTMDRVYLSMSSQKLIKPWVVLWMALELPVSYTTGIIIPPNLVDF